MHVLRILITLLQLFGMMRAPVVFSLNKLKCSD